MTQFINAGTRPHMSPEQLKQVRHDLGLSLAQLAPLLDTDEKSLRCMEADPRSSMFREPPPRLVRLLEAYLIGYRPPDWPQD